ncbi:MAG TPA: hypothetical protein VK698_17675 [Kofleriaceae bacterium]|nr:hypothetical protein [Kofleriaceae bacterium]
MKLAIALPVLFLLGCAIDDAELTESASTEEMPQPCRNLLDRLSTPTGSTVDFCAFDDGVAVVETAMLHTPAYVNDLERHWRCPSDLYADLAHGAKVPPELEEDCRRRTESGRVPLAGSAEAPPLIPPRPTLRSHYCAGGSGDNDFVDEKCSLMQINAGADQWYDSMWWCHAVSSTQTQRTASSQLGHAADKVRALLASCNGTSNFKLSLNSGGWGTEVDTDVLSGYWVDGRVYTALTDKDLRFNGDAYGSAWYRNTGMFGDFEYP